MTTLNSAAEDYVLVKKSLVGTTFSLNQHEEKKDVKSEDNKISDVSLSKTMPPMTKSQILSLRSTLRGMGLRLPCFRTTLGFSGTLPTSAAGVLATGYYASQVSSSSQFTAVTTLFEEIFVHSFRIQYSPTNDLSGGQGYATGAFQGAAVTQAVGASKIFNVGMQTVSLFGDALTYTTADAMLSNPTIKYGSTGKPHIHVWRNKTKFEKNGVSLSPLTDLNWTGWMAVDKTADLGGGIYLRTQMDQVVGTGAGVVTLGTITLLFDVSLRSRA